MIAFNINTSASSAYNSSTQVLWLYDTLLYLRDDLLSSGKLTAAQCPPPSVLEQWVKQSYHPGLAEMNWNIAMIHLLNRIRVKFLKSSPVSPLFIDLAQQHLEKLSYGQPH